VADQRTAVVTDLAAIEVRVSEVAAGVHQLSTYLPDMDFSLNQYVVDGDEPLLFHTGMRWMFPMVSAALTALALGSAPFRTLGAMNSRGGVSLYW
jgi:hypothetical protein